VIAQSRGNVDGAEAATRAALDEAVRLDTSLEDRVSEAGGDTR
jgi:hypothetical protein